MLYQRELMIVDNTETKHRRFYMLICDVWQRISEKDYDTYVNTSINSDCYLTTHTRKHIRHSAIYYYDV